MSGPIPKWAELEAMSNEELKTRYDNSIAGNPAWFIVFRDELRHREQRRYAQEMARHTEAVTWLTVIVAIATLIQLGIVLVDVLS